MADVSDREDDFEGDLEDVEEEYDGETELPVTSEDSIVEAPEEKKSRLVIKRAPVPEVVPGSGATGVWRRGRPKAAPGDPRCVFTITRGQRKGMACDKVAKVGTYCKVHSESPTVRGGGEEAPEPRAAAPKRVRPVKTARVAETYQDWGGNDEGVTMSMADAINVMAEINASKAMMKARGGAKARVPKKEAPEEPTSPEPKEEKKAAKKELKAEPKAEPKKEPKMEPVAKRHPIR